MNMTQTQADAKSKSGSIGRILLEAGKIKAEDADRILQTQKEFDLRFGDAALKLKLVTEDDILRAVSQQFHYASLPVDSDLIDAEVVAAFRSHGNEIEELRTLRSQLALRWFSGNKALVVSSPTAGQGATYVSANLAVLFSQLGEKTLLIDADMRTPRIHSLFKLANKQGLSDMLASRAGVEAIHTIEAFDGLSVLTAGTSTPNPLELLSQHQFWSEIEKNFDVIIIDTPPALESADAQSIVGKVGGALVVVRNNESRLVDIENMKSQFSIAGADVVGAVVNDF
ncbi:chain length determinant protein tyrosine kinase EpsG [Cycloclasticus pugetii]|uniref:chain length determinant protein tyrosine kinase EpsG n=1 Tax=Cycloclasticus pugetii TaxID=34068 RepID=UPI0004758879|nr:chain length determinant protein tyrosine kinase EpsG [Cycloclasticus pugetii]